MFSAIVAGEGFSCGLGTDSLAYCWGTNFSQRLGVDSVLYTVAPVPVGGGIHFTAISAGGLHACGLTAAGAAYCWGDNATGQLGLGDGAPPTVTVPQPVTGNLRFGAIAAGSHGSCAITPAGEAYCWGANEGGQVGGSAADVCNGAACSRVPVAVSGGLRFGQISVGDQHACGLSDTGTLYCWGKNDAGQLGDGTRLDRAVPTRVAGQS
jgi:alpha-tubulin suppressor-like RCC1 family protein